MAEDYVVEDDDKKIPTGAEEDEGLDDVDSEEGASTDEDYQGSEEDNGTDEDREAIRERRRLERQQKKQWRKEHDEQLKREREMLRRENEQLNQRLAVLERRSAGAEFAQLDGAIEQTGRAVQYLKEQIKLAVEAGDGTTVAEATEKLTQAQRHAEHLQNIKRNAANQSRQTEQRSPIDPQLRQNAETWVSKNSWYDPNGADPDSRVALTIDNTMAEEGWDPRLPEYWTELDARLKRYLPHRYNRATDTSRQTRTPVTGSGRESGMANNSWKLSADRVNAIKEAGAWDDPTKRDAMIRRYREFDKNADKK